MSTSSVNSNLRIDGRHITIMLAVLCAGLVAFGLVAEQKPLLAIAAVGVLPALFVLFRHPDSAVPIVLFLLYSNAVVVAVRFHGVPALAGAVAPAPLLIPLFVQLVIRGRALVAGPALPWLIALTAWQLLSALLSSDPNRAIGGVLGTVLEGVMLYMMITNVIRDRRTLRHAVWALIAAGTFMGSISAYQQVTRSFHSDFGGFGQLSGGPGFRVSEGRGTVQQRRLSGPIGEKNRYAQIMLMLIPLAISRFWIQERRGTRLAALYCAMAIGIGGALTFSRSGAIAFVLMVVAAVPLRFVSPKKVIVMVLGGMLVLLIVPQYRTRLATIPSAMGIISSSARSTEPDGAIRGRATEMLAAARIAIDHPVLGVGPDMSSVFISEYGQAGGLRALEGRRQSHCMFLEIPAETGFPGFLVFMAMVGTSFVALLRASRAVEVSDRELSQTGSAFLLAMTGYLVMGLFLHMSYVRYFWLLLAMLDACTQVTRQAIAHGPASGELSS